LNEQGFFWVNAPIIAASDAEGAGASFRVSTLDLANLPRTPEGKVDFAQDFFGREAFLTVSGQLNIEAYCLALTKVYTFGPTFRAENSNTSGHLAEFWMVEPVIISADLSRYRAIAGRPLQCAFLRLPSAWVLTCEHNKNIYHEPAPNCAPVAKLADA
jgi:asparaginyl-tRNA synthetase